MTLKDKYEYDIIFLSRLENKGNLNYFIFKFCFKLKQHKHNLRLTKNKIRIKRLFTSKFITYFVSVRNTYLTSGILGKAVNLNIIV